MRNGQQLPLIASIQEALLSTLKLCKTAAMSLMMALFITMEQVISSFLLLVGIILKVTCMGF